MKKILEKISILSLSLMLVSTFAISPALPQMIDAFAEQGIGSSQVEFLVTVTSLAIMAGLLLNPLFVRFLSERKIIAGGLLLLAIGGVLPAVVASYPLMFLARILMGLGLGMINARAINIVGTHFSGKERVRMMGLRGSAEVLGSASLTLLAGWLTGFGWQATFLIYLLALLILMLFLAFVPMQEEPVVQNVVEKEKLNLELWKVALGLAFLAFFVINVNTFLTIRIPVIVTKSGLGTAIQASWILSSMQLMGIVAGTVYALLIGCLKNWLLPLAYTMFGLSVVVVALSQQLLMLGLGAMISGFFYSIVLTIVFSSATEKAPKHLMNAVMTIVLMGCNIGGATASIFPTILEKLNPTQTGAFGIYAVCCFIISFYLIGKQFTTRNKH
ncbi:MFS transporter [Streptococcus ovis]|uniref:MFS transporter n=1 Tax=Streptococcus ovis TaxID=82806 RepID=UPI00036E3AC5|nr:MFS transporter [Streptococcus ovis]